mmetsp:Transcript_28717/g.34090  ORF Transcript_28717/g.34090 Transcript_28717/m.34090 type:complete len:159 (-) Transcript_28717:46-522(-)
MNEILLCLCCYLYYTFSTSRFYCVFTVISLYRTTLLAPLYLVREEGPAPSFEIKNRIGYILLRMLRRSLTSGCSIRTFSTKPPGRNVLRDPRKRKVKKYAVVNQEYDTQIDQHDSKREQLLVPWDKDKQSFGSSMGSYMFAGAGMALGFTLVGAIFGV